MIQLFRDTVSISNFQSVYLDFYGEMTDISYPPLFSFTSHLSGKTLNALPKSTNYTNKERYVIVQFIPFGFNLPSIGVLDMGNTDYPYGIYSVTVYQNNSSSNLDPDNAIKTIWNGLMNLRPETTNEAVNYTEYTNNDSENDSVYITAVANN